MPIINPPSTLTPAQQAQTAITNRINILYSEIKLGFGFVFNEVWNNPQGLTAQQVFDAFGTDAAGLFKVAAAIQTAMNTIQPGSLPQAPPKTFTLNQDGTVTVTS